MRDRLLDRSLKIFNGKEPTHTPKAKRRVLDKARQEPCKTDPCPRLKSLKTCLLFLKNPTWHKLRIVSLPVSIVNIFMIS